MAKRQLSTVPEPEAPPNDERGEPARESQTCGVSQMDQEQLDEEEKEFRSMRRDLPGVKGASAAGVVATSRGAVRVVPVRQANNDGEQNEYARTKEIGLVQAEDEWVRLYTDMENHCYQVFPAPAGRFSDPQWPQLKPAKIYRLSFRDKGRLVDSPDHPLFKKWAARDSD